MKNPPQRTKNDACEMRGKHKRRRERQAREAAAWLTARSQAAGKA